MSVNRCVNQATVPLTVDARAVAGDVSGDKLVACRSVDQNPVNPVRLLANSSQAAISTNTETQTVEGLRNRTNMITLGMRFHLLNIVIC